MAERQYSVDRLKKLLENARKALDELPERRRECENAGRHLKHYEYFFQSRSNKSFRRIVIQGCCIHCLTFTERDLTNEERQENAEFLDSLRDETVRCYRSHA